MKKFLGSTLISVCIVAAGTTAAIAQPAARADWHKRAAHRAEHAQRAFSQPTERVEARLAYIRTALKIGDAQQPQWDAYAQVVRKNAQALEERLQARRARGQEPRVRPNAIERLERVQSFHAQAITHLNELLAVEKPLYASLSPEQRKVADVVLNPRFGYKRGAGRHGGFARG